MALNVLPKHSQYYCTLWIHWLILNRCLYSYLRIRFLFHTATRSNMNGLEWHDGTSSIIRQQENQHSVWFQKVSGYLNWKGNALCVQIEHFYFVYAIFNRIFLIVAASLGISSVETDKFTHIFIYFKFDFYINICF